MEKTLGLDHQKTLNSVNNLGETLRSQGKYDEVEIMHRRSLAGREEKLVPDHRDTLESANNLGAVLHDRKKNNEMESIHRYAAGGGGNALGPHYQDVRPGIVGPVVRLLNGGKYEEDEITCRHAPRGTEKALGQEYQEVEAILQNPKFVQDLFHQFQNALDACLKTHYGNQFTRVINNGEFLLFLLHDMVVAHSDAPKGSNTGRRNTGESQPEGRHFQDNWRNPCDPPDTGLARLHTLLLNDNLSPISRAEIVQVIANVDEQVLKDSTMSDPHNQNQPQQRRQAQPPASPSLEICKTNTAPSDNPQTQQTRAQQSFYLARTEVPNQKNPQQPSSSHIRDTGESSSTRAETPFASGRKQGGKRVAGRWTCLVEDCPKRNEPMQKCRLDDHMARHEPNRRTQCPSCGKIYMHSRTCNEHHKKAHGMELKKWYELRANQFTQQAASLGDLEGDSTDE